MYVMSFNLDLHEHNDSNLNLEIKTRGTSQFHMIKYEMG